MRPRLRLSEAHADLAGQLMAAWVFQQWRNREMAERSWGRFTMSNGMPVVIAASYHRPDHLRPRYLASPDAN